VFFSLIAGMRAASKIGTADKRANRGDVEGVLRAYSEALAILDRPGVDIETPWCRSTASVALWGYCRSAVHLRRAPEAVAVLSRWRARYLPWRAAPTTADEGTYLEWFEELLQWGQEK
jgi:hypothetical protein